MSSTPGSIPDVAEQLMREFEGFLPISVVTETVMRVCRDGGATLSAVADAARLELARIVAAHGPLEAGPAPAGAEMMPNS
ncbi:MAG: hypothetical protein ACT4QG_07085 [Sporichthyaceae bacterium]